MAETAVVGGKGKPDASGMHVPLIVGGAGVSRGLVIDDLVDSTDFLPTICEAAGIELPSDRPFDGRSFYPQCKGAKGRPRDWIYCWYARDGGKTADAEFARDRRFKLMRQGKLFDVSQGDDESKPIKADSLNESDRAAVTKLQAVLDRYRDVRPERISALAGKKGTTE
jgi:arylsulfatase A